LKQTINFTRKLLNVIGNTLVGGNVVGFIMILVMNRNMKWKYNERF